MTNWLIGGFVVIAVALGGFFLFGSDNDAMMEKTDDAMEKENTAMMDTETSEEMMKKEEGTMMNDSGAEKPEMMAKAGTYETYAPEKLAKAATGKVVLFFRAGWCPTCKALDMDIRSHLNNIPADVTILDVNYDTSAALKQKYGVTYQHTLVQVDAQGNMITKWSGGLALSDLVSKVQ